MIQSFKKKQKLIKLLFFSVAVFVLSILGFGNKGDSSMGRDFIILKNLNVVNADAPNLGGDGDGGGGGWEMEGDGGGGDGNSSGGGGGAGGDDGGDDGGDGGGK